MTPMKAIRAKCLDYCCGSSKEVRLCPCVDCALYPFRFGRNPNRAGLKNRGAFEKKYGSIKDLTDEQREEGSYTTTGGKGENYAEE